MKGLIAVSDFYEKINALLNVLNISTQSEGAKFFDVSITVIRSRSTTVRKKTLDKLSEKSKVNVLWWELPLKDFLVKIKGTASINNPSKFDEMCEVVALSSCSMSSTEITSYFSKVLFGSWSVFIQVKIDGQDKIIRGALCCQSFNIKRHSILCRMTISRDNLFENYAGELLLRHQDVLIIIDGKSIFGSTSIMIMVYLPKISAIMGGKVLLRHLPLHDEQIPPRISGDITLIKTNIGWDYCLSQVGEFLAEEIDLAQEKAKAPAGMAYEGF